MRRLPQALRVGFKVCVGRVLYLVPRRDVSRRPENDHQAIPSRESWSYDDDATGQPHRALLGIEAVGSMICGPLSSLLHRVVSCYRFGISSSTLSQLLPSPFALPLSKSFFFSPLLSPNLNRVAQRSHAMLGADVWPVSQLSM
jgi:hypothetical protein